MSSIPHHVVRVSQPMYFCFSITLGHGPGRRWWPVCKMEYQSAGHFIFYMMMHNE